jgi:hypothetical protein
MVEYTVLAYKLIPVKFDKIRRSFDLEIEKSNKNRDQNMIFNDLSLKTAVFSTFSWCIL